VYKTKLLNLRIIREDQTGNLWRSVGRQNACLRPTNRIPVRMRETGYVICYGRQAT